MQFYSDKPPDTVPYVTIDDLFLEQSRLDSSKATLIFHSPH